MDRGVRSAFLAVTNTGGEGEVKKIFDTSLCRLPKKAGYNTVVVWFSLTVTQVKKCILARVRVDLNRK